MKKTLSLLCFMLLIAMTLSASAQSLTEVILSASTTQAFKDDSVAEDDLNIILQAGLSAVSAINQQPWHFAVLTNPEIMKEISASPMGGMSGAPMSKAPEGMPPAPPAGAEGAGFPADMPKMPASTGAKASLGDSPAAIIIYMNENTPSPDPSFDCGLAAQNMMIAANALGYGTKIVSAPTMSLNGENHDEICAKLGVDPAYKAVAVLLLGYTDPSVDGATGASVRSAFEDKVSFTN